MRTKRQPARQSIWENRFGYLPAALSVGRMRGCSGWMGKARCGLCEMKVECLEAPFRYSLSKEKIC